MCNLANLGRRHFVHLSLACVLSLAILGVLLRSWKLCLVLGLASILSLANFLGFATCQYIEASETFKFCNFCVLSSACLVNYVL